MQGLSTNKLLLGSGILEAQGNTLLLNGSQIVGGGGGTLGLIKKLYPEDAQFMNTGFPQYILRTGINFPVSSLGYDDTLNETAYWKFDAHNYTGTNLMLDIYWYADTASTNNVVWATQIAAITPETDSQDVETKGFGAVATGLDSHLGSIGQRIHKFTLTLTDVDSLTQGDIGWIKIYRSGSSAGDNLVGDVHLERGTLRDS